MSDDIDRGDMGEVADPSWTSIWSRWLGHQIDSWFFQAASWGPLTFEQSKALIQGLPPPPAGSYATTTVMQDFAPLVARLKFDMQHGVLPPGPMPNDLANWCDQVKASLPTMFVYGLWWAASGRDHFASAPQAPVTNPLHWWLPPVIAPTPSVTQQSRKRGRPCVAVPVAEHMRRVATDVLMKTAREDGVVLINNELARRLRAMPEFADKLISNITSRLKGHLPRAEAREAARLAIVRKGRPTK